MIRGVAIAVAAAAVLAALLFARPHDTPGPPMRDFEAYYAAGVAWQHGTDPYGTTIWNVEKTLAGVAPQRFELLPFVGPPATLPLWSALATLSFERANTIWRVVLVLFLIALVVVTLILCEQRVRFLSFVALAVFALGFGPLTSAFALGQVALPAFVCAALALLWPPAGIFAWAQPNVAAALVSQTLRRKGALAFVGGATIFVLACAVVGGWHQLVTYVQILHAHEQAERFSTIQITPAAIAYGLGASPQMAASISTASMLVAIGTWIVLMRREREPVGRFCGTCAILPFVMPFFHEHDLLVLFIPSVYFALRCSAQTWPLAAAGALLCATDWLGLAQRPDGAIQTMLLVGSSGIALIALRNDLRPPMFAVPACVLGLITVAALVAQTHAAPVWPDAMHTFAYATGANSAAELWHREQVATGLLTANPFWAALRGLSLLGVVVLVASAVCHGEHRLAPALEAIVLTRVR